MPPERIHAANDNPQSPGEEIDLDILDIQKQIDVAILELELTHKRALQLESLIQDRKRMIELLKAKKAS